jgi:hypothetical protein
VARRFVTDGFDRRSELSQVGPTRLETDLGAFGLQINLSRLDPRDGFQGASHRADAMIAGHSKDRDLNDFGRDRHEPTSFTPSQRARDAFYCRRFGKSGQAY